MRIIKWPCIFMAVYLIGILILAVIFNYFNPSLVGSELYNLEFQKFLEPSLVGLTIFLSIIFIVILYKKVPIKNNKVNLNIKYFLIGFAIAIFYNILIFSLDPILKTNLFNNPKIFPFIITTGIFGPILEEFIFRGIIYNELKKNNSVKKSILLSSLIFGIIHLNIIKVIYGFILGLLLSSSYEKTDDLAVPIIIHVTANTSLSLLLPFIVRGNIVVNICLFLISFVIILIFFKKNVYLKNIGS